LQRLRSFVEAARLGSFAAAAQALGYTPPAVSQHVALLERELGCELLVRGARGVRATPAR
jgi:DNA-binding transcriptional LysR family regulator